MKHISLCILFAFAAMVSMGCSQPANNNICNIKGSVSDSTKEGKKIFLVPVDGVQDAAHVDSVVITDGKFEFKKDTTGIYVIRLDYHFRDNVQELLVVTEPGDVNVVIGPNSTTAGTPQNDSLQVWKDNIISRNITFNKTRMQYEKTHADSIMTRMKEQQKEYTAFNKSFRARQPKGVFKDFLRRMTGEAK